MNRNKCCNETPQIIDHGGFPLIVNIERLSNVNSNYRTTLWTGEHLQVTLMSIPVGGDIGLEIHSDVDQFIRIENGRAMVVMGQNKSDLNCRQRVNCGYAVIVPAGTWHNVVNIGNKPLKLYSIYAPKQHPFGTVHRTKKDAEET